MGRIGRLLSAACMVAVLTGCTIRTGPLNRGFEAFADGNYAKAETEFFKALEDDPDNPYVQLNLGAVFQNTGRPEMARFLYQKVLITGKDVRPSRKANTEETDKRKEDPTLAELAQINMDLLPPPPSVK